MFNVVFENCKFPVPLEKKSGGPLQRMGVPSGAVVGRRIEGPASESFPESCAGDILLVFKKDVPF